MSHPTPITVNVPGDAEIAQLALLLSAVAEGNARLLNLPEREEVAVALEALRRLGVRVEPLASGLRIFGRGLRGLRAPDGPIDCRSAATTFQLLAGLLAGQRFRSTLLCACEPPDDQLAQLLAALRQLGAQSKQQPGDQAVLSVGGGALSAGTIELAGAGAELRSAVLLAGLNAQGALVCAGLSSADGQTERLLQAMAIDLTIEQGQLVLYPPAHPVFPYPVSFSIPGDPAQAAMWWAAAASHPGALVTTTGVSLGPQAIALIARLRALGTELRVVAERSEAGLPVGDVSAASSGLRGSVEELCGEIGVVPDQRTLAAIDARLA